jgi:organic hydroperoxide reductase OsmC/OhrA
MATVAVELRNVEGTGAAMGWAGGHTVVVDRPAGKAGGLGLGFNGAQLLALSLGGCFCNDLRYAADQLGVQLGRIEVSVELDLDGDPPVATAARMKVVCETAEGAEATSVVERARSICTIANTLRRGVPVQIG